MDLTLFPLPMPANNGRHLPKWSRISSAHRLAYGASVADRPAGVLARSAQPLMVREA
jgi:hypothetical protein